jgi:NADH:ubiquinone oxidoreductase subunit
MIQKLKTWLTCDFVGEDEYGNKYYISKYKNSYNLHKRYVIYNGMAEPSKVPPMWHAWLHYLIDEVPMKGKVWEFDWQKKPEPNLTGTRETYLPPGHENNTRDELHYSSEYNSWDPSASKSK